jgi:acetyltransferase
MLKELFYPESIAVIGASRTPGKVGHAVVKNLVDGGFRGTIIPVNPSAENVYGLKCYKELGDYKGGVELGVITVPAPAVEDSIRALINAHAKAAIIITAGFKETGPEGAAMQTHIAEIAREGGIRILGPNVVGLINTHNLMNASFALSMPKKGNISVIAQSGAVCTVILDWAQGRRLGVGKLISMGNKADLTEVDFIQALAEDDETKVIVGYLEDILHGNEFIKQAEAAASKKPVILLKVGTSEAGKKAASSHTGSLAGADIAYGAAFRRAGVIRAEHFEDMLDFATAFSMQPIPAGDRVAIITNAGGLGIIAADAVENSGMKVAKLSPTAASALKEKLPKAASVGNPIDVLGDAPPERYAMAVEHAQKDENVDAIILLFAPQAMTKPVETVRAVAAKVLGKKPVLAAFMGGHAVLPGRDELVAHNLPDYTSAERAVAALKAMYDYSLWLNRPPRIVARFPVNRRRVERIITRFYRMGRREIGEVEAKQILKAYDFTIPDGQVAATAEEAVEIATRLGFPVAMKIYSPDIIHKSDIGGVKINLATPDAVRDAFELMILRTTRRKPGAQINGVYIEKMAPPGREVILGMTRDPHFGPMLMFGLGGIFVEVMKDVTFHLAPITADEAMQMLRSTRSYALLEGARGQAGVDTAAIAGGLQRISQLVTDFPDIEELDINPLLVGPVGMDAVAADARITLRGRK